MARIGGVDLPRTKRVDIGLTAIFGIGRKTAAAVLAHADVAPRTPVKSLTDDQTNRIRVEVDKLAVEGKLRTETSRNIRRLSEIGSYRGQRHQSGMPVRGQRTRTNARTRKGPRGNMFSKKKK